MLHGGVCACLAGRPVRLIPTEVSQDDFLSLKFRQACSWSAFTIDRNEIDWVYNVFVRESTLSTTSLSMSYPVYNVFVRESTLSTTSSSVSQPCLERLRP